MATKKTTVHPLTAFRKANEVRLAPVKKSIQKAQEGFQVMAGPLSPEDDLLIQKKLARHGMVKSNRRGPINIEEPFRSFADVENMYANNIRRNPTFNTQRSNSLYKKGGITKKKK
jgi:hypothetical protein